MAARLQALQLVDVLGDELPEPLHADLATDSAHIEVVAQLPAHLLQLSRVLEACTDELQQARRSGGAHEFFQFSLLLDDENEAGKGSRGKLGKRLLGQRERARHERALDASRLLKPGKCEVGGLGSRSGARAVCIEDATD